MLSTWLFGATEAVTETAQATASTTGLTALPLVEKGLLTTLFGLVGVFLVLFLFYISIKLMQKIGTKKKFNNSRSPAPVVGAGSA